MDKTFRVQPVPLLNAIVDTLKQNSAITMPKNFDIIKTGHGREQSPDSLDWFYMRMAAITRQAMLKGKVSLKGIGYRYGNRKNMGVRPSRAARSSDFVNGSAISELIKIGWFNFENKENILTENAKTVLGEIIENILE